MKGLVDYPLRLGTLEEPDPYFQRSINILDSIQARNFNFMNVYERRVLFSSILAFKIILNNQQIYFSSDMNHTV